MILKIAALKNKSALIFFILMIIKSMITIKPKKMMTDVGEIEYEYVYVCNNLIYKYKIV